MSLFTDVLINLLFINYGYFYTFCNSKINKLRAMFIVYSGPESSTVFRESLSRVKSLHYELKNDAPSKSTCPHFV